MSMYVCACIINVCAVRLTDNVEERVDHGFSVFVLVAALDTHDVTRFHRVDHGHLISIHVKQNLSLG
jgi:hypothetical protein